jgi:hypothetical protein
LLVLKRHTNWPVNGVFRYQRQVRRLMQKMIMPGGLMLAQIGEDRESRWS